jgi:cytochrome P450
MSKRQLRSVLPPGPRLPSVLQLAATWTRPAASIERLRQRYGKRITVQLPFQPPFVILSDPEEIKELFTASPEAVHPGEGARILEPTVGSSSVILMTALAEKEVGWWPRERPVALHPHLQRLTLEIILRTVFGLEQGPRLDELRELLTEVLAFSESPLSVLPVAQRVAGWIGPLRRFNELIRRADQMIFELIEERKADPRAGERDDVLAMLLQARHEDGSEMSRQELRDELMTALVAGHETTASQLAWGFEQLARAPRVAAHLSAELERADGDEYLTATIHEILRCRPVLPNAEPRLTKQPVTIGGFEYPAGVALLASAYLVHHDPEIYPEPYAFRPERFLGNAPGTYTWIPFGGGRRRCLGASFALVEMKIVLRAALTRYEVAPASDRPERTGRRSITYSPAGGATVILRDRNRSEAMPRPLAAATA